MISTKDVASLCADALVSAGLIAKEQFLKAEEIIEEEIRVRISLGQTIVIDSEKRKYYRIKGEAHGFCSLSKDIQPEQYYKFGGEVTFEEISKQEFDIGMPGEPVWIGP